MNKHTGFGKPTFRHVLDVWYFYPNELDPHSVIFITGEWSVNSLVKPKNEWKITPDLLNKTIHYLQDNSVLSNELFESYQKECHYAVKLFTVEKKEFSFFLENITALISSNREPIQSETHSRLVKIIIERNLEEKAKTI